MASFPHGNVPRDTETSPHTFSFNRVYPWLGKHFSNSGFYSIFVKILPHCRLVTFSGRLGGGSEHVASGVETREFPVPRVEACERRGAALEPGDGDLAAGSGSGTWGVGGRGVTSPE